MGSDDSGRDMVVFQVSFGGFDRDVSAKEHTDFLETEIGLVWRNALKVSIGPENSFWNRSDIGVDFIVESFDGTCKFLFTGDTAFSFRACFLSSALTADDDINGPVPFDLLDDDDPWIRTTDFTYSDAICQCNIYKVSIQPCHGLQLRKAMNYLRNRRGCVEQHQKLPISIQKEPHFAVPIEQPREVNMEALKHVYSYRRPVFKADKRLKLVQEWLLRNPKLLKSSKQMDIAEVNSNLPYIERNDYVFSDGIGMITPDLALEVGEKLQLKITHLVHIKLDMQVAKELWFAGLEKIITLLSALEVPDEIFWNMQGMMISKLNLMLYTLMWPLMFSLHHVLNKLGGLLEKGRIFVPCRRWLMGCLDELGVLEQGQCFIQVSTPSLENCFSNHSSSFTETKQILQVIQGLVAIAKNPCLHLGDTRILEAVDKSGLHHLSDCLVFLQKGERPHTNEASGSDLDGDLYFVTWDDKLIPPSKRSWTPMEYAPVEAKKLPHDVNYLETLSGRKHQAKRCDLLTLLCTLVSIEDAYESIRIAIASLQ
ncbi:RNA-dependent RNA polymerase, eukaryotic-type [Dillenia turbinata]|uniref:RNA-dependent RNA polymerase n=1 Tax=Dillenia turbinata TaxID=194707 RepID=A0AAN8V348_9MAGN